MFYIGRFHYPDNLDFTQYSGRTEFDRNTTVFATMNLLDKPQMDSLFNYMKEQGVHLAYDEGNDTIISINKKDTQQRRPEGEPASHSEMPGEPATARRPVYDPFEEEEELDEAKGFVLPLVMDFIRSHPGTTYKAIIDGIPQANAQSIQKNVYSALDKGTIRRDQTKQPYKYYLAAVPSASQATPAAKKPEEPKTVVPQASKIADGPAAHIVNVLKNKPGISFVELLHTLGVIPKSAGQIKVFTALKAGLLSGAIKREKDGLSFKYYVGDGTPTVMKTINRQPKAAKVPASQKKKEVILNMIKNDISSFRPDGDRPEDARVDGNSVSVDFRHLGNWVDDEENSYEKEDPDSDEYDPGWREDNDNRIWDHGEYQKYAKLFKDWAKGFPWRKYVDLSLQTSEKDWCEFYITLKQKDKKPYRSI